MKIFLRKHKVSSTMVKKKSKTTQQITSNTERKSSGSNWEVYKSLFSIPKREKKNGEQTTPRVSVRKHTQPRRRTPRYLVNN